MPTLKKHIVILTLNEDGWTTNRQGHRLYTQWGASKAYGFSLLTLSKAVNDKDPALGRCIKPRPYHVRESCEGEQMRFERTRRLPLIPQRELEAMKIARTTPADWITTEDVVEAGLFTRSALKNLLRQKLVSSRRVVRSCGGPACRRREWLRDDLERIRKKRA